MSGGRRTSADWARKIEHGKALLTLAENPGWQVIKGLLEQGIINCQGRMLMPDCQMEEIQQIRGVVSWMRTMLKAPEIADDQFAKWQEQVVFCRTMEKMREELGVSPLKEQSHEEPR